MRLLVNTSIRHGTLAYLNNISLLNRGFDKFVLNCHQTNLFYKAQNSSRCTDTYKYYKIYEMCNVFIICNI